MVVGFFCGVIVGVDGVVLDGLVGEDDAGLSVVA
jgi:hypothetical protein